MLTPDTILMIHGDDTVARIRCAGSYTHNLFNYLRRENTDYVVACTDYGGVLWVADGMSEQVWEPESTNPEETRKETLDRFPELAGKW